MQTACRVTPLDGGMQGYWTQHDCEVLPDCGAETESGRGARAGVPSAHSGPHQTNSSVTLHLSGRVNAVQWPIGCDCRLLRMCMHEVLPSK